MNKEDKEYLILKSIKDGEETIKQRDIAKIANISLGSANTIIKRLLDKGLLKAKHISNKNIHYIVTPIGIAHLTKRSTDFLKRTIKNVVVYKDAIDKIVEDIKNEGYTGITIDTNSDFNFLIEYSCLKYNLKYNDNTIKDTKEITDEYILKVIG